MLDGSIIAPRYEAGFTYIVLHLLRHVVVGPEIRSRQFWELNIGLNSGFCAGRHVASLICPRSRYGEITELEITARYLINEEPS